MCVGFGVSALKQNTCLPVPGRSLLLGKDGAHCSDAVFIGLPDRLRACARWTGTQPRPRGPHVPTGLLAR